MSCYMLFKHIFQYAGSVLQTSVLHLNHNFVPLKLKWFWWFPYITATLLQDVFQPQCTCPKLKFFAGRLSFRGAVCFIVFTVWSRIIAMHWKQRSMTGTDRWGDKLHIYTMYYILTQHCHLSYIGQGENKAVLFGFFVILSLTLYPFASSL